jgi:hypothetical protein
MTDPRTERTEATRAPGHGQVRAEEDRIPSLPIVAVGVGALAIFFLASWVTIRFLQVKESERPPLPVPQEIGLSKIGLVEQQLFESATRGEKDREAHRQRLGSYGWVDRKAGIVHLPIDRAMELSAQGVRPRASPPEGAAPEAQP